MTTKAPVFGEQEIRQRNQAGKQPRLWEMRVVLLELDRVRDRLGCMEYVIEAVRAFQKYPSDLNMEIVFARLAEADAALEPKS